MGDDGDDDTVPTGRAAVDPLIAYPEESTGTTGEIDRPGESTPWWFIPGMFVVALGFIALLVYIGESRSGGAAGGPDVATSTSGLVARSTPVSTVATSTGPTGPTGSTVDPVVASLPDPGTVRVGGNDYQLVARCEVHLPYEPVDTDTQVSSYFFFDERKQRSLVERTFDGERETATRTIGDATSTSTDVIEIGTDGAFSADFDGAEVVVNPPPNGEGECDDRVVTNPPGRLAEPHVQIVLDVCVDTERVTGTAIAGLTSEGARFEIQQAGGELGEIVLVRGERGPRDLLRTNAPATLLRTADRFSASGVVSNGTEDLDITIDVGASNGEVDGRPCSAADQL